MNWFVAHRVPSLGLALICALVVAAASGQEKSPAPNQTSPPPKTDRDYFSEGRSLEEKKNYWAAVEDFHRAIAINPKEKTYYNDLGFCFTQLDQYDDAIAAFNEAIAVDPKDSDAYRSIGLCYFLKNDYAAAIQALDEALKIKSDDFDANYLRGMTALRLQAFSDASRFLGKAADVRPNDFDANCWGGISLVGDGKFKEALPRLEKAHELKPNDMWARFALFASYLETNQPEKAVQILPIVVQVAAGMFVFIYCVWLAILLPFSLPVRAQLFPGFWFSVAWLGLFCEGQIAFLLLLAALPSLGLHEIMQTGMMIAALPVVATAFVGFARQPWGEPFKWPLRFGNLKTIAISLSLMFGWFVVSVALAQLYVEITHKPVPYQHMIPFSRALQANPVVAWLGVVFVIPWTEEILFRGLIFGAFQKLWGVRGALIATSILFVFVHLRLIVL